MVVGTFIGVNKERRLIVGPNFQKKTLEEFMQETDIKDPKDVVGDFETILIEKKKFPPPEDAVDEQRLHKEAIEEARRAKIELAKSLGMKTPEPEKESKLGSGQKPNPPELSSLRLSR